MRKIITFDTNYGMIHSNLKEVMDRNNISISAMSRLTGIKYDVVKRYYFDEIFQVDLQVLSKFCYILGCNINDILSYNCIAVNPVKQRA